MYIPVIGLEVHLQLTTKSKMFCGCSTNYFGKEPNSLTCPVCLGLPGSLPVINEEGVKRCIKLAYALNCSINKTTKFDRKNYFYPDLPKGYQISQYDQPIGINGFIPIEVDTDEKRIRITRVHLEEDTAKSIHSLDVDENGTEHFTLIDFNKSGIPLVETVTEPDFQTSKEVIEFARSFQKIARYLDISDADMEKGQLRFEVNISIKTDLKKGLPNYKVEVKNISSISVLEKVIEFEIQRQSKLIDKAEKIIQETRGIDDKTGETYSQRIKEEAHDYRYFPEPDLPVLEFSKEYLQSIKNTIPELPLIKKRRFIKEFGIDNYIANQLVENKYKALWFEKSVTSIPSIIKEKSIQIDNKSTSQTIANWIVGELESICRKKSLLFTDIKLAPKTLAYLVLLSKSNQISAAIVKSILEVLVEKDEDVDEYIKKNNLIQINDEAELDKIIEKLIQKNPEQVKSYKNGKIGVKSYFVGLVMKETKGRSNPTAVDKIITKKLS